jgi:O-acetyl-ADP-ribose deacetylase (regulator of RNase III)
MIVLETESDILQSAAQSLVCPVNTVGVMGKGLALAFASAYPGLLAAYQRACQAAVFKRDGLFIFETDGRKIICLPTKRHWRFPSKIEWIEEGLYRLASGVDRFGIESLAVPAIGCGEGKLMWTHVYPIIVQYLQPIETPVAVHLPR